MTICILGRQPEIGLAELEALYGAENVRSAGDGCALVDAPVDFSRLGGSVKAADVLDIVSSTDRKIVFSKLAKLVPKVIHSLPSDGKVKLGLSVYGFNISAYDLGGEALRLKKSIRNFGRSVRVVPNEAAALSSAQTYHNQLAGPLGLEFVVVKDDDQTVIARVTDVQNIDSYRIRDRERPKRDAFVGMLPPKLAQIIVNLAVGQVESSTFDVLSSKKKPIEESPQNSEPRTQNSIVLDPFCGTGVMLQEALLMGYDAYGTDLSAKMVDYTKANLEWLESRDTSHEAQVTKHETRVEVADATTYSWDFSKIQDPKSKICVASETYLGQPLGGQQPSPEKLAEIVHDTNKIVQEFLKNIAPQLLAGTRLCLAVPAWFVGDTVTRLPVVSSLDSLGFSCHTFRHVVTPLIYHRDNQTTGRDLLVLTKE